MESKIKELIKKYAEVYQEFEVIQKNKWLPGGDQKTGVIGEFYAKCYAETLPNVQSLQYAKAGETHDLACEITKFKIQVKCVSSHSKTKTIAPINLKDDAFSELYLIYLNEEFIPVGFYINTYAEVKRKFHAKNPEKDRIIGAKMHTSSNSGSPYLDFSNNLVDQLLKTIA